ncbi:unnamed protein product, partial [Mesorhabditis belari]|uniref:Uncharacterized protein n=1 Tax=Mesorhabditis belari TaxID=2138241 RepID=A0AAF3FEV1_9BILA
MSMFMEMIARKGPFLGSDTKEISENFHETFKSLGKKFYAVRSFAIRQPFDEHRDFIFLLDENYEENSNARQVRLEMIWLYS